MGEEFKPAIERLRIAGKYHRQSAADWRRVGKMAEAIEDERKATAMDKAADLLEKS